MSPTMSSNLTHLIPEQGRRRLLLSFLTVVGLHAFLLSVPSARKEFSSRIEPKPLAVRLIAERAETKQELDAPAVSVTEARRPSEYPSPERFTQEPIATEAAAAELAPTDDRADDSAPERQAASALPTRIMSSPYLDEDPPRFELFPKDSDSKANSVEFRLADRSTPDLLIFPQSVALPFADAPRLAVEFYDDGVMGGVQRFWDSVTFARTWTTKHGTKVSCGVVLVIPACVWD
jgi:hypothetical protein